MAKKKQGRAPNGSGSYGRTPSGGHFYYFSIKDPKTGEPKRKKSYGDTKEKAYNEMIKIKNEVNQGIYKDPSKLTVEDWFNIWSETHRSNAKENTRLGDIEKFNAHFKIPLGKVKLTELTSYMIQKTINNLKTKNGKPLSPKSKKNVLSILHGALEQAVKDELIKKNYATSGKKGYITLPTIEKKEIQALDDEQVKSLQNATQRHKFYSLFRLAVLTGIRQGELLGLTWDCIDFKNSEILIDKQLQEKKKSKEDKNKEKEYELTTTKNGKSRLLKPVPKSIMLLLFQEQQNQKELKEQAGDKWQAELKNPELKNLVFTDELGINLDRHTVYKNYKRVVDKIGIPDSRFHDLRHTYARICLDTSNRNADDFKTLSENMGHHSVAFTIDKYGKFTEKMRNESADQMEAYISRMA